MGSVWRGEHLGLRAPVAVKLLGPDLEAFPQLLERFYLEAQSAANLRSPHVVQVLDYGVDQPTRTPFIVMELLEGETLAQRLERLGSVSPEKTCQIATHVARALTRAHELGIVHRDLKPANIFLVSNDDEELAKVLDFGIAKWTGDPGAGVATYSGFVLGTPFYMSPEQIGDTKHVDFRTDLWALGVTIFECLFGQRPFTGENVMEIGVRICSGAPPEVPGGDDSGLLTAWLRRTFAPRPGERWESARQLVEELRRCFPEPDARPPAPSPTGIDTTTGPHASRADTSALGKGDTKDVAATDALDPARLEARAASDGARTDSPISHSLAPGGASPRQRWRAWTGRAAAAAGAAVLVGLLALGLGSRGSRPPSAGSATTASAPSTTGPTGSRVPVDPEPSLAPLLLSVQAASIGSRAPEVVPEVAPDSEGPGDRRELPQNHPNSTPEHPPTPPSGLAPGASARPPRTVAPPIPPILHRPPGGAPKTTPIPHLPVYRERK